MIENTNHNETHSPEQSTASEAHTVKAPSASSVKSSEKKKRKGNATKLKTNAQILREQFPLAYIENGLNATKAYKSLKKTTDITARVEGSKTLSNPIVREKIQELLNQRQLTVDNAIEIHKRNMFQEKHLPTSQKAVELVYELQGVIKRGESGGNTVNVGIVVKE